MIIKRILNNNAVMSVDESGEDIIVKGKGIAFQKKSGDEINQNKIDKIFVIKKFLFIFHMIVLMLVKI